jgi:mRNA interferase MazF
MAEPNRGEVWLVDLGMAAKTRPCLVLSIPAGEQDRSWVDHVAHTTSPRGSQFEVPTKIRFLKPGAFDAQNLVTVPHAKLIRRLGKLTPNMPAAVEEAVRRWLGFSDGNEGETA